MKRLTEQFIFNRWERTIPEMSTEHVEVVYFAVEGTACYVLGIF